MDDENDMAPYRSAPCRLSRPASNPVWHYSRHTAMGYRPSYVASHPIRPTTSGDYRFGYMGRSETRLHRPVGARPSAVLPSTNVPVLQQQCPHLQRARPMRERHRSTLPPATS